MTLTRFTSHSLWLCSSHSVQNVTQVESFTIVIRV